MGGGSNLSSINLLFKWSFVVCKYPHTIQRFVHITYESAYIYVVQTTVKLPFLDTYHKSSPQGSGLLKKKRNLSMQLACILKVELYSCKYNRTTVRLTENKDSILLVQISRHTAGPGMTSAPSRSWAAAEAPQAGASVLALSSAAHVQQTQQQLCGGAACRAVSRFQSLGLPQAVRVHHAALWGDQREVHTNIAKPGRSDRTVPELQQSPETAQRPPSDPQGLPPAWQGVSR